MKKDKPRVSIGMPVLNGENYIRQAIDSILAQTHSNFELIISDNASTDRTQEICMSYANLDRRIRYHRNEVNLGAARNFNRVFELSSGEYFKWAAHDDVMAPEFLSKCVAALDRDSGVVLAYPKTKFIDEAGHILGNYVISLDRIASPKPQERFGELVRFDSWCLEIFGLIRADALGKTRLIGSFNGSDRNLLAELGLLGRFQEVPEYLFFSRDHAERSIRALPAPHLREAWFDPAKKDRTVYPHWRNYFEFIKSVALAPVTRRERAGCYLQMALWPAKTWNWTRLTTDLIVAAYPGFWKLFLKAKNIKHNAKPLFHIQEITSGERNQR